MHSDQLPPIGLVAAWGRFPVRVAEALKARGRRVCCLAVKQHADPSLRKICDEFHWIGPGKMGQALGWFHDHNVKQATMAGKFHKVMLYKPWLWWHLMPDAKTVRTFWPHFVGRTADRKDDALLGVIVTAFAEEGIEFLPATDFAPELLVPAGSVAGSPPSEAEMLDIEFGWELAKELGRLDIGQSVCVKERTALAVEAIEGTDLCIRRAGQLCQQGEFTVVKVSKPQQDMRFDVPTVGIGTLESMVAAGARVLAIEGDLTILLDEAEFRQFATKHRLKVIALPHAEKWQAAA